MLRYGQLLDLRRGPVSAAQNDDLNPLNGLLGQILGQAPEQQKAKLEEAVKNANDLSSFVKKKKQSAPASVPAPAPATTGEKRSVDADGEQPSKRAKVEESTEE